MKNRWQTEVGMHQKKSLGQVFLTSATPLQPMLSQVREWGAKSVLEIGPGEGVLTKELMKQDLHLTCVEKDHRFALFLQIHNSERFKVEEADILDFPLLDWAKKSMQPAVVVGNIPYNISTPILMQTLNILPHVRGVILMTQLEFAERLAAEPDTSEYGSISVFAQLRSHISILGYVDKTEFKPVPKVDSALVCIENRKHDYSDIQLQKTEKLTRHVFQQRRKKLSNSLRPFLKEKELEKCPVDLNLRPEVLPVAQFVQLADFVF